MKCPLSQPRQMLASSLFTLITLAAVLSLVSLLTSTPTARAGEFQIIVFLSDHTGKHALQSTIFGQPLVSLVYLNGTLAASTRAQPYNETYSRAVLSNLTEGEYFLRVYWHNRLVYEEYVLLAEHLGNITTIVARTNTTFVKINICDSEGEILLKEVEFTLTLTPEGTQLISRALENGTITLLLAYGRYCISRVAWRGYDVTPTVNTFTVSGITELQNITVKCRVHQFIAQVKDAQGKPFTDDVSIQLYKDDKFYDTLIPSRDGRVTTLLPQGEYTIKVFWKGVEVREMKLSVTKRVEVNITVPFYETVKIYIVDGDRKLLQNAILKVLGDVIYNYKATNGTIVVHNLIAGKYHYVVSWSNYTFEGTVLINATTAEIRVPLYSLTLILMPEKEIPIEGFMIKLYGPRGIKIQRQPSKDIVTFTRMLNGTYFLEIYWYNIRLLRKTINLVNSATVPCHLKFCSLKILVTDVKEAPLPGAKVQILLPNGTNRILTTDASGTTPELILPNATYEIAIYWEGLKVKTASIELTKDTVARISLNIFDVVVLVKGRLGQVIKGAEVKLVAVLKDGTSLVIRSSTTNERGEALLKNVPLTPEVSYYYIVVTYIGRVHTEALKLESMKYAVYPVQIDVVFVAFNHAFTLLETIGIIIVIGLSAFLVIYTVKYVMEREEIESMFEVAEEEEEVEIEEGEEEGLLERIKRALAELVGWVKGEEEY